MRYNNILYITDLDGTLLNSQAELSEHTISELNKMIDDGMNFTVATARTIATTMPILSEVNLSQPIILMNGVLVYDMGEKRYVKKELLTDFARGQIDVVIQSTGQAGLMYGLTGETMETYYERLDSIPLRDFVSDRISRYGKKFVQSSDFRSVNTEVIYYMFLDTKEKIDNIHRLLSGIKGVRIEIYHDIYSDDLWYLEVFSEKASKQTAVEYLRKQYSFEHIIGFGDNLNDIPLFAACNESYAVANAKDEVKAYATAVIESNDEDGVVKWLRANYLC